MTIEQAIIELKARGAQHVRFNSGKIWFEINGQPCSVNLDYRAQVKPQHVAMWFSPDQVIAKR